MFRAPPTGGWAGSARSTGRCGCSGTSASAPAAAGRRTACAVPRSLGGAGAISVHQLGADSTWCKFAGNFGAGLEYRFGRVGLRAEGRDVVYKFDRYGFDKTQHDIAWQGGLRSVAPSRVAPPHPNGGAQPRLRTAREP